MPGSKLAALVQKVAIERDDVQSTGSPIEHAATLKAYGLSIECSALEIDRGTLISNL